MNLNSFVEHSGQRKKLFSESDRKGSAERISINALISQPQDFEEEQNPVWAYHRSSG